MAYPDDSQKLDEGKYQQMRQREQIAEEIAKADAEGRLQREGVPPPEEPMLRWFEFRHLPPHLQTISMKFWVLASWMVDQLPRNNERTAGLRKLLEAKDCAVRAFLDK